MAFWVHAARARHPDRIAVEGPERTLTYAELSAEAIAGRRELRRRGIREGERVALALAAPEDFVVALHACQLAGAVAVPVDLRLGEAERAERLAGAELVVSEPLVARLPSRAPSGTPLGSSYELFEVSSQAPLAVMHTSGTTAAPKPVVLTHGNWLASALGSAVALGLDPAERWLCPMPLIHVGGLSIPVRSTIYATTAVLHGRFDVEAVLAELMDPARRITMVSLVPTMLARLLDAGLERPSTLRWALLGGGPIPASLLKRAKDAGVPVAPTYGMTEACSQIATFGWPLAGVEIRTSGSVGEVAVRGPIVSAGALSDDGWLYTGDLGRLDERGRLEIVGRLSDTIVTGGENVAPEEIESVLLDHPGIADAAVHGRADREWGEAVVATVVVHDGAVLDAEDLRRHCAARLAPFKVPKAFEFAARLPRTASGKLLRRSLG